ncbi:MAG: hypothetical protein R3D90_05660 [Paracoccaceae bacterium]
MNCVHCADVATLLSSVAGSTFSVEIVGSLIGAFAGAYAATRFAEKKERNALLVARLEQANLCLSLCAASLNSAFTYKRDVVKDTFDRYIDDRVSFEAFLKSKLLGDFYFHVDFREFPEISLVYERLVEAVLAFNAASSECIHASMTLHENVATASQSVRSYRQALADLQEEFKALEYREQAYTYFGIENKGKVDRRVFDPLTDLKYKCDAIIYLSFFIAESVLPIARRLDREIGTNSPGVRSFNLSHIRNHELFPDVSDFTEWESFRPAS